MFLAMSLIFHHAEQVATTGGFLSSIADCAYWLNLS